MNQYGFSPGDLVTFDMEFKPAVAAGFKIKLYDTSPRSLNEYWDKLSFTVVSEEYINDVLCVLELDGPWVKVVSRSCNGWIYYSYLQPCK